MHASSSTSYHYKPAHREAPLKSLQTGEILGTVKLNHSVFGAPQELILFIELSCGKELSERKALPRVGSEGRGKETMAAKGNRVSETRQHSGTTLEGEWSGSRPEGPNHMNTPYRLNVLDSVLLCQ